MKALFLITLACVSYVHATLSPAGSIRDAHKADKGVPSLGVPQSIQQTWAMFSSYYPAAPYAKPPQGCAIDQVHILQRHGARYPTSGVSKHIKAAIKKLQSVDNYTDPNLAFIKDYQYDLHNGNLVPFGHLNLAKRPLEFCGAEGDEVCWLDGFVESQAYARKDGEGDWEKCFE